MSKCLFFTRSPCSSRLRDQQTRGKVPPQGSQVNEIDAALKAAWPKVPPRAGTLRTAEPTLPNCEFFRLSIGRLVLDFLASLVLHLGASSSVSAMGAKASLETWTMQRGSRASPLLVLGLIADRV